MNLEDWLRDSKRWIDENSSPLGRWVDDARRQFDPDPKNTTKDQSSPQWQQQISEWGQELTERFKNLNLETNVPESLRNLQDFDAIQEKLQNEWFRMADWFKLGDRYRDAIQTLIQLYLQYRFDQLNESKNPEKDPVSTESERHLRNAKELAELCRRQGGAWIKAAQFLSTQGDWLPREYRNELAELQDQAPSVSWENIVLVLQESYGSDWASRFRMIDPEPVATASLAQVHRAILPDGSPCALKIQIPGAPQRIDADLKFFALASKLFKDQLPGLDPEQVVRELSRSILLELDYAQEAENLIRFSKRYESSEWTVPRLIPELLSPKTLGMNYVVGTPIRHFLKDVPSAADSVLKTLVSSFMRQIFISGLFHADPHPGNFFITPRGQIALLDFGAMGELSPALTLAYQDVLTALLMRQQEGLIKKMTRAGFVVKKPELLLELLFPKSSKGQDQERVTKKDKGPLNSLEHRLRIMREGGVELPDSFVLMARVLISLGGLMNQHHVKLKAQELVAILMKQQND